MTNGILVIGNGFDLLHGRKTKYSHFLDFIKSIVYHDGVFDYSMITEAEKHYPSFRTSNLIRYFLSQYNNNIAAGNWIDMERDLKYLIKALIGFIDEESGNSSRHGRTYYRYRFTTQPVRNNVLLSSLKGFSSSEMETEFILKDEFVDSWGYINKEKVLSVLETELEGVICLLEYYLSDVEPQIRDCNIAKSELIEKIAPSYVISFNYTDTYESVYGNCSWGVTYLHGRLGMGNIVLGYDDENDFWTEDIAFKKYYQRLVKRTDTILRLTEQVKGVTKNIPIYFVGHSLDFSDEDILRRLIRGDNPVCIYCMNEVDRANKIENVIKLIGKKKTKDGMEKGALVFDIM